MAIRCRRQGLVLSAAVAVSTTLYAVEISAAANSPSPVDFDLRFAGYADTELSGDGDHDPQVAGKLDAFMHVDGDAAGLWGGLSIDAHFEYVFGGDINDIGSGIIWPVNLATALPRALGDDATLSLTVTQAFNEKVKLSLGKFNIVDRLDHTPLVGGNGRGSFLYAGIAAPPTFILPPYVLGGRLEVVTKPARFVLYVYDARNAQGSDFWEAPFSEGTAVNGLVTFPITTAGLPGFYSVSFGHSTAEGTDFESLLLPLEADGFASMKKGFTYGSFRFQQYLHLDPAHPGRGWGVFGQLGIGDGNPNQLGKSLMLGVGGNSPISGRSADRWGVAFSWFDWSETSIDGLKAIGTELRDEWVVEAFYEAEVTENLRIGMDAQAVRPGTVGADQAYFLGFRTRFLY